MDFDKLSKESLESLKGQIETAIKNKSLKTYAYGEEFWVGNNNRYMLVRVDSYTVCLVCIASGDSLTPPKKVNNSYKVTLDEMNRLTKGLSYSVVNKHD